MPILNALVTIGKSLLQKDAATPASGTDKSGAAAKPNKTYLAPENDEDTPTRAPPMATPAALGLADTLVQGSQNPRTYSGRSQSIS